MSPGGLSEPVRAFITQHVASVLELDVLLAVRSADRPIAAADLARELRLNDAACAAALGKFEAAGLVRRSDDGFSFAPADARSRADVDAVAEAYATRRVSVVRFIFRRPSRSVSAFADAFKLRKDD